ncbi:7 transmembrane receptor (rhodopsin), partial [Halocaridina rubra]
MYYIPLLIVVGFVGNLLSCVVFLNTRLRMRSSSYYLAALAIADVTYLFILFLVWLDLLGFNTFNVNVLCQLEIYLGSVSSSLSVWLTVAFTVERFIAVQYPLQRPTVCTVHRAKTIILSLLAFSAVVHIYVFITAGIIIHEDE